VFWLQVSASLLRLALLLSFPEHASLNTSGRSSGLLILMRPDAFLEFFFTASMFSVVVMSGSVYPGSEFVKEALERATELTDAAYARASDRYT